MNNSLGLRSLPLLWPLLACSLVVTTAVACLPTLLLSSPPSQTAAASFPGGRGPALAGAAQQPP